MKLLKEFTAFLLCVTLVLCNGIFVLNATADEGVVFELDTVNLTDKSGNNIAVTQTSTIATHSFTNQVGETMSYITPADENVSMSNKGGSLITTDERVAALTSYTVEVWAKYNTPTSSTQSGLFAQYGADNKRIMSYVMMNTMHGFKVLNNESSFSLGNIVSNSNDVSGKWSHFVFTVETTKNGDEYTSFTYTGYLDGVLKRSNTVTTFTADTTAILDGANTFRIGGIGGYGFPGDIAEFKIYSDVKGLQDVQQMYAADKDRFIETTVSADSITFENGDLVADSKDVALNMPCIRVEFDDGVDMSTVTKDTLKLIDESDGLAVNYTINAEGNIAIISCADALGKNKQYCLELTEGIKNADNSIYGQFRARFYTIRGAYAADGWTLSKDGNTLIASLTAKSDNAEGDMAEHILSICQICDGYVLPVKTVSESDIVTNGSDLTITEDLSGLTAGTYQAVSMLWGADLEVHEIKPEVLEFTIE